MPSTLNALSGILHKTGSLLRILATALQSIFFDCVAAVQWKSLQSNVHWR